MISSRSKPIPTKFAIIALASLVISVLSTVWSVYSTANNSRIIYVERNALKDGIEIAQPKSSLRFASNSENDEVTNSTSKKHVLENDVVSDLKFCSPRLKCPRPTDYHQTCKNFATEQVIPGEAFGQPPPIPSVRDPSNFLEELQSFFHGKRVALIGDSLTRQWFETLSCRLGLHLQFYEIKKSKAPQRVEEAQQYNIKLDSMKPPKGKGLVHPYMRAVPDHFLPLDPHDPLPSLTMSNRKNTTRGCTEIQTTMEYFKYELGRKSAGVLDLFANVADVDVIVFNIGIHYGTAWKYLNDLHFIMEKCAQVNSKHSTSDSAKNSSNSTESPRSAKKLCLFRETFPRHWLPRGYRRNDTSFGKGEEIPLSTPFDKKLLNQQSCGPFLPGIYPVRYNPNSYVDDIAYAHDVGVVKVEYFAKSAWKWHFPGDCTHYCHDDEFWDLVHQSFVDTAVERW
ncbi:hypothetical protein ACHAXS_008325 [Conticribra weissflogii]